jgi:outer membrane protein OmpA-like peptidoglycan-associated protein
MRRLPLAALLAIACGAAPPPSPVAEPVEEPVAEPVAAADPDHDGVAEGDLCPCVAEDADGFDDGDGCPDLDDDGDGVMDACDRCVREAEVMNGVEDDDGCPDEAGVRVSMADITILPRIVFRRNDAALPEEAASTLDEIARVMREHPQILVVAVRGHTSSDERRRQALALRRAEAVVAALVARGVEPGRLVAEAAPDDQLISLEEAERNRVAVFELRERAMPSASTSPPPAPPCEVPAAERFCAEGPSAVAEVSA